MVLMKHVSDQLKSSDGHFSYLVSLRFRPTETHPPLDWIEFLTSDSNPVISSICHHRDLRGHLAHH